jgi:arabinosyltransferase B/arabinosyltransferase C
MREYPGWTVAMSTTKTLLGQKCGLTNYLFLMRDTPEQPVASGPASTQGAFQAAAGEPAPVPPPTPDSTVWHDALLSGPETGELVTPWFALPAKTDATHLLVPLLGRRADQQLSLQYATAPGPNPPVAGSTPLEVDLSVPDSAWQQASVALGSLGPHRPTSVRLVVRDQITGAGTWIAVAQPRLAAPHPLPAGEPVYVDQVTATLLPCVDQVSVAHGIAGAPQLRILGDEGFSREFLDLGFEVDRGGTQVQADRSATTVRIPSWLAPEGPPTLPWGRVERVVYDYPVGLVDLHVGHEQRSGWTRLPTLADKAYDTGRTVGDHVP